LEINGLHPSHTIERASGYASRFAIFRLCRDKR
jgi:hypothetical protein